MPPSGSVTDWYEGLWGYFREKRRRLSEIKGLWTLIEAARLLGSSADVQIKIIGDVPLKESLEHRVRSLQLKNVSFLGYMNGESL